MDVPEAVFTHRTAYLQMYLEKNLMKHESHFAIYTVYTFPQFSRCLVSYMYTE